MLRRLVNVGSVHLYYGLVAFHVAFPRINSFSTYVLVLQLVLQYKNIIYKIPQDFSFFFSEKKRPNRADRSSFRAIQVLV